MPLLILHDSEHEADDMTNLERIRQFKPLLIRMMAIRRERGRLRQIPQKEIMKASGLSRRTIGRLSYLTNLNGIGAETIARFADGCGVDLFGRDPIAEYLERDPTGECGFLNKRQRKLYDRLRTKS